MMTRISNLDPPHPPLAQNIDTMDSWKLYENPYYCSSQQSQHHRKAFIWDLNFIRVLMESELEKARAEIKELKAELEYERKARRRAELMNKKLAKDVAEEMQHKRLLSCQRSEIVRMKQELEEEREMHKLAEVLREERVQMKLEDARLFLEEKLSEFERSNPQEDKILESTPSPASNKWENLRGIKEFPRMLRAIKSKGEQWSSKLECQKVELLRQKSTPRSATHLDSP